MNGDTPKKPAEGDWQTDTYGTSNQEDMQKPQTQKAAEVVVANLRDTVADQPQSYPQPEQGEIQGSGAPVETPEAPQATSVSNPPEEQVPAQPVTPTANPAAGWTTTINGEAAWDLADAEIEAHENQIAAPEMPSIQWTASEFIVHQKSPVWYLSLVALGTVLALFSHLVIHDAITTVAVVLITVLFIFVASHKPRTLPYRVDGSGVTIGNKMYSYAQFKAFGIVQEGAFSNITFVPLKRFGPMLSIYYPPEEEDKIVEVLSAYMPTSQVKLDFIDKLLKSIHL